MFHYIICSFNHTKPFASPPLALMCCRNLMQSHKDKRIFIDAFCLMPDHLHLCVEGIKEVTAKFVGEWKSYMTHESWRNGWSGKLWQERFLIKEPGGPAGESEILDYILNNPVRACLVSHWKQWLYWAEPPYGKTGWGEAAPGLAP